METFPCLKSALLSIKKGGLYPTLLNSANEELVQLFLDGRISFLKIGDTIAKLLETPLNGAVTVESILETEKQARQLVHSMCQIA